jgi:hypothetical protein
VTEQDLVERVAGVFSLEIRAAHEGIEDVLGE